MPWFRLGNLLDSGIVTHKNTKWVFVFQKYGKFWSISFLHFEICWTILLKSSGQRNWGHYSHWIPLFGFLAFMKSLGGKMGIIGTESWTHDDGLELEKRWQKNLDTLKSISQLLIVCCAIHILQVVKTTQNTHTYMLLPIGFLFGKQHVYWSKIHVSLLIILIIGV